MRSTEIRPLREPEVAAADRVFRLAFGTFLGLPDPASFGADASYVRPRWSADPGSALVATDSGEVVGSNFATRWGSVGFFGPLTVHPDHWDGGVGKRLIEPVVRLFDQWGVRLAGLFTFSQSSKHVALYQKFGFHPRFLTAILARSPEPRELSGPLDRFSTLAEPEKEECLQECSRLTGSIYAGLDVREEIRAIDRLGLGDTVLLRDDGGLQGFAACHHGAGTEAGSASCLVKLAAVRSGPGAADRFERLLDVCEAFALRGQAQRLVAGCSTAREEAYGILLRRGYRIEILGIAMHRPNDPGYSRPGAFVLDDWR